jgi:hypothetical protein
MAKVLPAHGRGTEDGVRSLLTLASNKRREPGDMTVHFPRTGDSWMVSDINCII